MRNRIPPTHALPPSLSIAMAATLALALSCSSGSSTAPDRLKPPPEAGTLQIEMSGTWEIVDVQALDHQPATMLPLEFPYAAPISGNTIEFVDGRYYAAHGQSLLMDPSPDVFTHLNVTDGRIALFDYGRQSKPNMADGGSSRMQLVFGSRSANEMIGFTAFEISAWPESSRGTYRVRMVRR